MPEEFSRPDENATPGRSDDESLAVMAGTDRSAFRTLYRRYVDRMFSYFAWKFGRDSAADLTSEVFLRALGFVSHFDGSRSWAAWLYGIAQNVGSEHLRKRKRYQRYLVTDIAVYPDDGLLTEEERESVRRAVAQLPAKQREVVELRFWAGVSYSDISAITGRNEAALRAQVHRALAKLRPMFEERSSYETDDEAHGGCPAGQGRSVPEQG